VNDLPRNGVVVEFPAPKINGAVAAAGANVAREEVAFQLDRLSHDVPVLPQLYHLEPDFLQTNYLDAPVARRDQQIPVRHFLDVVHSDVAVVQVNFAVQLEIADFEKNDFAVVSRAANFVVF
jgi:hypothetical protein